MSLRILGALLALCCAAHDVIAAEAYLGLPTDAAGALPATLSATGLFRDLKSLAPRDGLIPYELNVPFWSDGADKQRWMAIPDGAQIGFAERGSWTFPDGTVFVKTFELQRRRLETRVLVRDAHGGVYGAVYKWRRDGSDADLLAGSATEDLRVRVPGRNGTRTQTWYYPGREDCLTCHTTLAGGVLGVNTRQAHRVTTDAGGNQLLRWSRAGLFDRPLDETQLAGLTALARSDDASRPLEDRARSWLDANCAQCHRPGGTVAAFDARFDTPLARQHLIDGAVLIDAGIDRARVIAPHDPWRSILLQRVDTLDAFRMPPLARNTIDGNGAALLRRWIESLPGREVVAPPAITPLAGKHRGPLTVTLRAQPGATIRYTLDGTVPTAADLPYSRPIRLMQPTIVRARAFAPGRADSIVSQQVYVIE